MGTLRPFLCFLLGLWNVSALKVELKEIVNPSLARVSSQPSSRRDTSCTPDGCKGILTRDGSRKENSRYGCTQPDVNTFYRACSVTYRLNELPYYGGDSVTLSEVHVAFTADSKTTLKVVVGDEVVVESWTGVEGSTNLQEIPGLSGYSATELEFQAIMDEGDYMAITETEIYVEVDDVPVIGAAASDRVSVTASATVRNGAAQKTIDGSTSSASSWSCSEGDTCEITYDLQEAQSVQQLRIAFVEKSSTAGATFNVFTAGVDKVFTSVLSGVVAGARDSSIEGMQTFGGLRKLARYVKIEGIPGSGGNFGVSEVDIRLNEDAPTYPTAVDNSLVPLGLLPLGADDGSSADVPSDPRPASESGCSAGHIEGCTIYNIKDGDNSPGSRWSCSPMTNNVVSSNCLAQFDLNTQRYMRQIQLAFHNGDKRHSEFSIHARTEGGWVIAIPSAISSGDTTGFQTWDLPAYTNAIQLRPKFGAVNEWISIKEMILLEKKQSSKAAPILSYNNRENANSDDILPITALKTKFSFDLENAGSKGQVYLGRRSQTARVWAVKMKFPKNKVFTFDISYEVDDDTEISTRFTSAGGKRRWERFTLPERVVIDQLFIHAVSGPDKDDYPTLRVSECQVLGKPFTPGSTWVVSTTIKRWNLVPDFIGDGSGDQEEIMKAICDGIGEGFDGSDCDGVAVGTPKTSPVVNLVMGEYYLDGPVFLKSGLSLLGDYSEDDSPYEAQFRLHGSGTGADGVIIADGVSGAVVEEIHVYSNLESKGAAGTVGNVCLDVKNSEDITVDLVASSDCPMASARFVDTDRVTAIEFYGGGNDFGNVMNLKGVTDFSLAEARVRGMLIEDSTNVLLEALIDDGDFYGSIDAPDGGDQSANLVVAGTTSGVTLRNMSVGPGAEPRIVLENSNIFTIDAVNVYGGSSGDCIIQVPQGSDGNAVLVQLNMDTELVLEGDCFVLA